MARSANSRSTSPQTLSGGDSIIVLRQLASDLAGLERLQSLQLHLLRRLRRELSQLPESAHVDLPSQNPGVGRSSK